MKNIDRNLNILALRYNEQYLYTNIENPIVKKCNINLQVINSYSIDILPSLKGGDSRLAYHVR